MALTKLNTADLRISIDPERLGFADTAELMLEPLPWIGAPSMASTKAWRDARSRTGKCNRS